MFSQCQASGQRNARKALLFCCDKDNVHKLLVRVCDLFLCCCAGRLWDCRTGRNVWTMEGHIKQVLALDFSPNGYQVVTGSDDHQAKVCYAEQSCEK